MVSLKRATTSCLVQKEKTQTRITFNNLSANLTVNDLYKYVQLHLEEDRPFELSLVCGGSDGGGGGGDLDSNASSSSASLKVSLEDKKQKTLLAAGLSFENGAANTVVLTSAPGPLPPVDHKVPSNGAIVHQQKNGFKEQGHKKQQQPPEKEEKALDMGVPHEQTETATNGNQPTEPVPSNGHATQPAEELNDFSRQITINTNTKIPDMDDDPAPLISPIEDSPSSAAAAGGGIPEPPPLPALEYHPSSSGAGASSSNGGGLRRQTSPGPSSSSSPKFVGLVNQAMTCYLNSLLQALYMTPEFRNAMYNWEFDGEDESKSIPYQLQRLFLNLQTSPKSAVETTDLTRSFGWDSSEAWQQHDIQELCRVMFDALEHKFKNTKESNLINRLYEGKMIDYLKCLSCGTEKQREDTFLDIPLPVKPFGSTVAFGSIEEALRAFIQPEILNGNNQYSCEKCQKKCDAHKGLKFSKFPYILTLHLKRFDFDYQTFHRIKLNDKVTFPQTLNLNGFVNTATDFATEGHGDTTTTNGETNGHKNGHTPMDVDEEDEEEEDKKKKKSDDRNGDEKQKEEEDEGKTNGTTFGSHSGPYLYELFAIMIHSGSASGGHYYVYIKDFDSGNWFCFNDQCVSPITQEDIQKSFGGSAGRYHYSGAYTTSTNAYMMMYRQCDPARNKAPTKVEDLPEHIQQLQKRLKDRQEVDNRRRNNTDCTVITTRVYHYDRERCKLSDVKIHISGDYLIDELLQRAYDRMSLGTLRSLNLCRLVAFDNRTETTLASIEHHDQTLLQDVLDKYSRCDFLLEERDRDEKFRTYSGPMVNARVYLVDLRKGDVDGPHRVPIQLTGTVAEMKQELRNVLKNQCVGELRVAVAKGNLAVVLDNDKDVLQHEIDPSELCPVKLFVASIGEGAESRKEKFDRHLKRIVERFDRVLSLYLKVPQISAESRKMHAIPDYVAPRPVEDQSSPGAIEEASSPVVVVKVEEPEPKEEEVAPGIEPSLPDFKALSPTPEPTSSASNRESLSSPSPEPEVAKQKEGSPAKVVKKKSLVPKAASDAAKSKEKSPVKTIETTKEITENGVTRRVKVIKRIVKKDPAKKAAAGTEASTEKTATSPMTAAAAAAEETSAPTKKIVKKTKVATTSSPKAAAEVVESPVKVAAPAPEEEQPKTNGSVAEGTVTEPLAVPKVEPVLPPTVDQFAFLDVEQELSSPGKYFRAIQKNKTLAEQNGLIADDELRLIQVHVDKNMTISMLKMCLEPVLEVAKEYFKINRSRTETLRLNEPVSNMSDGDECLIELGRILLDGEYKYRVSHMKLSALTDYTEDYEFLCDFIIKNNQRADEVKQNILGHLRNVGNKTVGESGPEKFRLWMKLYQNLSQVCTDEVLMGEDVSLRKGGEIVLEELEEGGVSDLMADSEDFVVFIRKWNPDTLVLESYQSMSLPLKSDLLQRISEKSGIPAENVEYARNMAPFPKMKISRANINPDMDWKAEPLVTSFDTARSGQVYFYRDKTVSPKELTAEEIAGIQQEETTKRDEAKAALNGGIGANGAGGGGSGDGGTEHGSSRDNATTSAGLAEGGSSSSYTAVNKNRRKERALKIYLDSSPAKVAS